MARSNVFDNIKLMHNYYKYKYLYADTGVSFGQLLIWIRIKLKLSYFKAFRSLNDVKLLSMARSQQIDVFSSRFIAILFAFE